MDSVKTSVIWYAPIITTGTEHRAFWTLPRTTAGLQRTWPKLVLLSMPERFVRPTFCGRMTWTHSWEPKRYVNKSTGAGTPKRSGINHRRNGCMIMCVHTNTEPKGY